VNEPSPSALVSTVSLFRPLAARRTCSPGWKAVPLTVSGCDWATASAGFAAVVVFEALGSGACPQADAASASAARALVRHSATARRGRVPLLVGAVARANERPREDGPEAESLALLAEPAELVRVHPAVDGGVLRTRLEVLPDRDDIHAIGAQVAHRVDHLV